MIERGKLLAAIEAAEQQRAMSVQSQFEKWSDGKPVWEMSAEDIFLAGYQAADMLRLASPQTAALEARLTACDTLLQQEWRDHQETKEKALNRVRSLNGELRSIDLSLGGMTLSFQAEQKKRLSAEATITKLRDALGRLVNAHDRCSGDSEAWDVARAALTTIKDATK